MERVRCNPSPDCSAASIERSDLVEYSCSMLPAARGLRGREHAVDGGKAMTGPFLWKRKRAAAVEHSSAQSTVIEKSEDASVIPRRFTLNVCLSRGRLRRCWRRRISKFKGLTVTVASGCPKDWPHSSRENSTNATAPTAEMDFVPSHARSLFAAHVRE